MNEEKEIEDKKEKLKEWFKDPYKIGLGFVILIAVIFRLYFFNIAKNQAHWWDSLAYGDLAKNMIFGLWTDNAFLAHEAIIRPPLLPWIWSFLLRIGVGDFGTILFVEILPSILSVWIVYLIAKELYDKKIALISSFIFAVSWIHIFYSLRVMTDVPALFFALASIYFFLKSYEEVKGKEFAISILFLALSVMMRYSYGLIAFAYIIFLAVIHRHRFLKEKGFWIGGVVGSVPLLLFFVLNLVKYGSLLPASSVYTQSAVEKASFAFYVFEFIPHIFGKLLTFLFIIGAIIMVWELIIGYDSISKVKKLRSHAFSLLLFVISFIFFVAILKAAEDRYLFIALPTMLIGISLSLLALEDIVKKYSKPLALIVIIGLLLFGCYAQFDYGKKIIEDKVESYKQMKEAFEWIKENTEEKAIVYGNGIEPYLIFYSERPTAENYTEADYLVLHRFEYQTEELVNFVNSNTGEESLFMPIYANFFDKEQTQPAVIVYKINK